MSVKDIDIDELYYGNIIDNIIDGLYYNTIDELYYNIIEH